jgi:hypothetical protein
VTGSEAAPASAAPPGGGPHGRTVVELASVRPGVPTHRWEFRRAAQLLGRVYGQVAIGMRRRFGDWALPGAGQPLVIDMAMANIFPSEAMMRQISLGERRQWYSDAYDAIMPLVVTSARRGMLETLAQVQKQLTSLQRAVADPRRATEIHGAARKADDTARGNVPADKTREAVARNRPNLRPGSVTEQTIRRRLAPAVAARHDATLSQLFLHPHGVELVGAFSDDIASGQRMANRLIAEAAGAAKEFATKVDSDPDLVWRFPTAIANGVVRQRLIDVPGFLEYALEIAAVRGAGKLEQLINDLGILVGLVGVATGPPGAAAAAAADFVLASANAILVYLREREQDLGYQATAFRPAEGRLAAEPAYLETAVAGAMALISGVFLVEEHGEELLSRAGKAIARPPIPLGAGAELLPGGAGMRPPVLTEALDPRGCLPRGLARDTVSEFPTPPMLTRLPPALPRGQLPPTPAPTPPLPPDAWATPPLPPQAWSTPVRQDRLMGDGKAKKTGLAKTAAAGVKPEAAPGTGDAARAERATSRTMLDVGQANMNTRGTSIGVSSSRGASNTLTSTTSTSRTGTSKPGSVGNCPERDGLPVPLPNTAGTGLIIYAKEYTGPDNTVVAEVYGRIGQGIARQGKELAWKRGSNLDLPKHNRAHLWGPRWGDETDVGVMYAPGWFNQSWQVTVEGRIARFQQHVARDGLVVYVEARGQSHPRTVGGGRLLSQVRYHIYVVGPDCVREWVGRVDMDVAPFATGPPEVSVTGNAKWLPVLKSLVEDQ